MTVYLDNVAFRYRQMTMCHMWADSLDELLEMADTIGLNRKWIQGHPELSLEQYKTAMWIHFDVSITKRNEALKAGAILTDRFGAVEHVAWLRLQSNNKVSRDIAKRQLAMIERARARRDS